MIEDVAVLCVEPGGRYPEIVTDWYDVGRDARTFSGGKPVVAHPPCGPWGKLSHMCKNQDETLGPWCVGQVRKWGGVLEHPAHSKLFKLCGMPLPGEFPDRYGGVTFEVRLCDFGGVVEKPTWLYCVGIGDWPVLPARGVATRTVESLHSKSRQLTPPVMADYLVRLAGQVNKVKGGKDAKGDD